MDFEEQWPVTDEDRRETVEALVRLIKSDDGPLTIRATRLVLKMEELNFRYVESESRKLKQQIRKLQTAQDKKQ